jgi:plasmid stabilization system protein ParE
LWFADNISHERAVRWFNEMLGVCETLAYSPARCPRAWEYELPEYELRRLIHAPYQVLFIIQERRVVILRILHFGWPGGEPESTPK